MKLVTPFVVFVCLLISAPSKGQNRIFGKITDAASGEPVPFANVFFVNTTFGTSSDQNGNYSFSGFPPGKYDLAVSFVGFNPVQRAVAFTQNQNAQIDVALQQEAKVLSEIMVKPDTLNWQRNYRDFKDLFLGTSRYAQDVVVQNPRDIHLFFDPKTSVLVAHARKPIVVDNLATGYRINYYLYQFEYNSRAGTFFIYGSPQFQLLEAKSKSQQKRWERNREKIYEGSLLHFMRSWLTQQWTEEGFNVSRLYRIPNRERPSTEFLTKKINELRNKNLEAGKPLILSFGTSRSGFKEDSLSYYMRLRAMPTEVDSVVQEVLTGAEFTGPEKSKKEFTGILRVAYKKTEDVRYAARVGRPNTVKKQESLLHVIAALTLYENGYYEDVRNVFLENYWSWSEKIATLLPLDYTPLSNK